jgi:hypothetical protein
MATHEDGEDDIANVDDGVEAHYAVNEIYLPFLDANAQEEYTERKFEE